MENVLHWAEDHPILAVVSGLGAVLVLLWLFGFFGSSSSSSSGNSLASAYYSAEAAQAQAGAAIQQTTLTTASQTAIAGIQANAATAIAATQYGAATTINGQNAGAGVAISHDQLLATINSNDDALAASNTAAGFAAQTAQAGFAAQSMQNLLGIIPTEFPQAVSGNNAGLYVAPTAGGGFQVGTTTSAIGGPADPATVAQLSPDMLARLGFANPSATPI